ncbi:MAG TPA: inositol monophosphatase family protein, partial [Myxococcaceae bacterium]|nr:inositol monophosphatase family protein [Myxococcaceae bacterium]
MSEARSWMEATEAVARVAGEVALRHYHRGVTVETKGDGTPVSVADRQAEEAARAWLEKHFPQDGILGEELGTTRPDARRRWILDPIDGTKTFIRRVPLWGTLVALAEGENVLAGAAYF